MSSSLVDTALAREIGRHVGLQAEEIDAAHRLAVLLRPHLRLRFLVAKKNYQSISLIRTSDVDELAVEQTCRKNLWPALNGTRWNG